MSVPATSEAEEMMTLPKSAFEALCADVARLRELIEGREARAIPDRPMSPREVATIVGKSEKTVRRWIAKRRLAAKTEGHVTLVRPVDLQRFLEGKKS